MKTVYFIFFCFCIAIAYCICFEFFLCASILFLLSQSIIGLYWLHRVNGGFYFQDIRVFFICTYSLYSIFLPLVELFGLLSLFENLMPQVTLLYASGLFGFNLVNMLRPIQLKNNISQKSKIPGVTFILVALFCLVAFSFIYMKLSGIAIFNFSEMSSRTELGQKISQLWIVVTFLVVLVINLLVFYFKKLTSIQRIYFLVIVLFYFIFQISLGNRREIATILFFICSYYLVYKKKRINISFLILALVLFVLSFYVTIYRDENVKALAASDAFKIVLASNEFVYPIQTTAYIISDSWNLRFGMTYVILPLQILIPRFIYPNKPSTLGGEFIEKTFGDNYMGFAYTPVSEAYLNFGVIGPFIMMSILAYIFTFIIKKGHNGLGFYYFLLYSFVFDFCRGDFSSIFYALLITYVLGYRFFNYLLAVKIKIK